MSIFTARESRVVMILVALLLAGTVIDLYGRLHKGGEFTSSMLIRKPGNYGPSKNDPTTTNYQTQVSTLKPEIPATGKIRINSATSSEIMSIPGIGPVLAGRIMEYRDSHGEFKGKADLLKVKGIGPKNVQDILQFVEFD